MVLAAAPFGPAIAEDSSTHDEPIKAEVVDENELFEGPLPPGPALELEIAKGAVEALSEETTANAWVDLTTGAITVGVTADADRAVVKQDLVEQGVDDPHVVEGSNFSAATNYGSGSYTYRMGHVVRSTVDSGGTVGSDGDLALISTKYALDGDLLNRSGAPRMFTQGTTSTTSTTVNSVDSWTSNGTAVCYSGMMRGVQCGTEVQDNGDGGFNVQDENYSYESSDGRQWNNVALTTKGWGKCPIPGDSGSPVYINTAGVGVAAHGILQGSGGGGDDHYVGKYEPSNCRMVFTEIGQAYQAFNGQVEVY